MRRDKYIDQIFDSSNEILKGLVRETFTFQKSALDGICAAAIHITQSQHLKGYYFNRKLRLAKQLPQQNKPLKRKDQLIKVYFGEEIISQKLTEI